MDLHLLHQRLPLPLVVSAPSPIQAVRPVVSSFVHASGASLPASYPCMRLGMGRIIVFDAAAGGASAPGERVAAVSIG